MRELHYFQLVDNTMVALDLLSIKRIKIIDTPGLVVPKTRGKARLLFEEGDTLDYQEVYFEDLSLLIETINKANREAWKL